MFKTFCNKASIHYWEREDQFVRDICASVVRLNVVNNNVLMFLLFF